MIILGIDPGTASTGWGVVRVDGNRLSSLGHGCIVTTTRDATAARLKRIHEELGSLLRRFRPDAMAVEELFVNVNVKTALTVGHARGVIMLAAAEHGIDCVDYSPLTIKQAVTGYGRASKVQVQEMTKVLLALDRIPHSDHAADALAVAITHAHVARSGVARAATAAPSPAGRDPRRAARVRR
jgi:crossover junction endodeoxyribonuclease RuvC